MLIVSYVRCFYVQINPPALIGAGLLHMANNTEKKTIHLAPLPSDWGDIHITASITTTGTTSTLDWSTTYPPDMPQSERTIMETTIAQFMNSQHEDLVRLFED